VRRRPDGGLSGTRELLMRVEVDDIRSQQPRAVPCGLV